MLGCILEETPAKTGKNVQDIYLNTCTIYRRGSAKGEEGLEITMQVRPGKDAEQEEKSVRKSLRLQYSSKKFGMLESV